MSNESLIGIMVLNRNGGKWLDERRHIKPPAVEKEYRGLQPEILFSPSREAALGK